MTVARRASTIAATRSHKVASISSREPAASAASVSPSRNSASARWRSLSIVPDTRLTAAATSGSSECTSVEAPAAAGSIESMPTARPASSGSNRAEPIASSAARSGGMRSSASASAISAARASRTTLTATGIWSNGTSGHSRATSSIAPGESAASGTTAWRGAS